MGDAGNSHYKGLEAALKYGNYAEALQQARIVPRVGLNQAKRAAAQDPEPGYSRPAPSPSRGS
jgi:hypothetical protein